MSVVWLKQTCSSYHNVSQHRLDEAIETTVTSMEQSNTSTLGGVPTTQDDSFNSSTAGWSNNYTHQGNIMHVSDRNLAVTGMDGVTASNVYGPSSATSDQDIGTTDVTLRDPLELTSLAEGGHTTAGSDTSAGSSGVGPFVKALEVTLALTGFIVNAMTCVILARHTLGFGRFTLLLLRHQSVVDCYMCIVATAMFLQPTMWSTGVRALDWAVCRLWHTQLLYWASSLVSAWNIVFIAVDRSVAICFPTRHKLVSSRVVISTFVAMHVASFASCVPPQFMVTFTQNGTCEQEPSLPADVAEKLNYGYAIYYLLVAYLLPIAAFVALYGRVLSTIRLRLSSVSLGASNCLSIATLRITKCAVPVTVIFVLTVGYDVIHFFVSGMGVTEYEFDSPRQLAGIFLNICNSVANPFVYFILLPTFRRSVRTVFRCTARPVKVTRSDAYESSLSPPTTEAVIEGTTEERT